MTEEEDVQFWDSSLDVGYSKQDVRAADVCDSSTQEYIGLTFILIV